jgi:hypothetical protein
MNKRKIMEVLTDNGWKKFSGVRVTKTIELYEFLFSDNSKLVCTPEHLIKKYDSTFIEA